MGVDNRDSQHMRYSFDLCKDDCFFFWRPACVVRLKRKKKAVAPFLAAQVWVKPSAELNFLYGNHVLKSGLGRITDNCTNNQGVIVMSMADTPLGFGVCMKSTQECRKLDPTGVVAVNQADVGEYLRQENEL